MNVCVHVCACVYMYVCLHVHWHLKLSSGPTLYNWHSLVYINHPLYMHIISGCSPTGFYQTVTILGTPPQALVYNHCETSCHDV